MQTARFISVAIAVVFITVARADEKPVALTRTYKAGEVVRYKSDAKITIANVEATQSDVERQEVKEVRKNGDVVLETKQESGTVTYLGTTRDLPSGPVITTVRDRYNRLVEFKVPESFELFMAPPVRQLIAAMTEVSYPEKPVAKDESWTAELDNPAATGKKVTLKTTYQGPETVDGVELWKVHQTAEAVYDPSGSKMTGEFTAWLDRADGKVVKAEGVMKHVPTQFGVMDSSAKVVLLKPDAQTKAER